MSPAKEHVRLSFEEALQLTPLDNPDALQTNVKQYVSRQPAWKLGEELPWNSVDPSLAKQIMLPKGAFGGVVYALAPLAAARAVDDEDQDAAEKGALGIHSIQGVFTNPGLPDRPFIFDVSKIHSNRSFASRLTNAYQPKQPSAQPKGPFPVSDAKLPRDDICFSCITTFKRPFPGSDDIQEVLPPQKRYEKILSSRLPADWEPSPQMDVDAVCFLFPDEGHGGFPILDMYKVDMTAFNADKPIPERRELILYRPLKPIPEEDVNGHIVSHAFGADRNGLIMLANHLGYGFKLGKTASLSYSFYVHTNAEEAVMKDGGWWIQEVQWPRYSAGRGLLESRIWSPEGKHVASGYQDGMTIPKREIQEEKGRL